MEQLLQQIIPLVSEYGLIVIFFGMIFEGTAMILIAGFLCYMGVFSLGEAWIVAFLGAVVGDHIWFYLGHAYGKKIINRFPTLKTKFTQALPFINSKADLIALFERFIYGGGIIFPFTLGIENYSKKRYLLFDLIGDSLWAIVGLGLGYYFSNGIEMLFGKIETLEHFLLLIIVIVGIAWLFKGKMFHRNSH